MLRVISDVLLFRLQPLRDMAVTVVITALRHLTALRADVLRVLQFRAERAE